MKILLIEGNPGNTIFFKKLIAGIKYDAFQLEVTPELDIGSDWISTSQFDIIVHDLLPSLSGGLEIFKRIIKAAGKIPVVVLTQSNDEKSGFEAVNLGAQDFLPLEDLSNQIVHRTLANAITRTRNQIPSEQNFSPGNTFEYSSGNNLQTSGHEAFQHTTSEKVPIKKNFEFLQELIDNIPSPIFFKNKDLIYTGCNKAFSEYIGHPAEKIIGRSVLEISPLELAVVYHDADARLLKSRGKQVYEAKVQYSDGTLHDVIFYKSVFNNSSGEADGIVGLIVDITEKKKNLEKLTLESSFSQGIAELSVHLLQPGQSIESIAKHALKYAIQFSGASIGYAGTIDLETEELIIHSFAEMVHQQCKLDISSLKFTKKGDSYPGLWGHALNNGKAFYTNDPDSHPSYDGAPDGHIKIQNFLSVPTISEGKIVGQIALANSENGFTNEDLNRIEKLSYIYAIANQKHFFIQELMMAKVKAEQSDKLKSAFLANMSHEIRTPLNAIVGFSEMLAETELSQEESRQFRNIINQNSEILLKLINDIIEMAMIEAGELKIKTQESKIDDIARDAYNYFALNESFITQKNQIEYRYFSDRFVENSYIDTDPLRLTQILRNLIHNAFRFTKSGFINFGYKKDGSGNVEFFVEDSGIGISKEQKQFIFEKFRQVDELKVRPYSGTGLGLSIAKKLVERLNGNISVDSEPGKGTIFKISFPLFETNQTSIIEANHKMDPALSKTNDLSGMKFLIVEDNIASFEFLNVLLKSKNCSVIHAKDGHEAMQLFNDNPGIDVILMDLQLPEMDGFKAIEAIRKIDCKIPVIVQTAYSTNIERLKALEAGCDEFLIKPITKREFFEAISRVLNKY